MTREDQPVSGAAVTVHGAGLEPVTGTTDGRGRVDLGPFPPESALRVGATPSSTISS